MAERPPDFEAPPWLKFLRRHVWTISFVLGIVTITLIRPYLRHVPEPPAVMFELPEYALVDQDNRPFTSQTLRGKVWVAGFIFTSCPSSCPAVTRAMADLRDRFDRNQIDVEMVSVTVDPKTDTPAVLKAYADNVGVSEHWRFVTGDPGAVTKLVRDGFSLGIGTPAPNEAGMMDIAHSTRLALVDADGGVRGFYGIEPDEGLDEIYHRAQHVLKSYEATR